MYFINLAYKQKQKKIEFVRIAGFWL